MAVLFPGDDIQELRSYTRAYGKLQHRITRILTKMDNIPETLILRKGRVSLWWLNTPFSNWPMQHA